MKHSYPKRPETPFIADIPMPLIKVTLKTKVLN
jgi:hypothetical protein